jgi:hypothetical protein
LIGEFVVNKGRERNMKNKILASTIGFSHLKISNFLELARIVIKEKVIPDKRSSFGRFVES